MGREGRHHAIGKRGETPYDWDERGDNMRLGSEGRHHVIDKRGRDHVIGKRG